MEITGDSVDVAIQGPEAFVRVHGRATFKIGPALKQFGATAMEKACRRIIVDMQDCVGMDSTFMGVLAGLATHLKKIDGEVLLRNASEKNVFLIKMLGINHLVRIEEGTRADSPMPERSMPLPIGTDKNQMTKTMITAHEALIEAAPDNLVKFKDVLVFLKDDLARTVPRQAETETPAP